MAHRAGDAGRDHAPAALVSLPPRQDFLLGAHGDRAAPGAPGAQAEGAQSAAASASTNSSCCRRKPSVRAPRRRTRSGRGFSSSARSTASCAWSSRPFPKACGTRAIEQAVAFVSERLNGEDGLGAIFPAMANSVMMFDVLGYPPRATPTTRPHALPSKSFSSSRRTRPIASPACRRCGTRRLPATRFSMWAANQPWTGRVPASTGCSRSRCSMSAVTGSPGGRDVRPGGWAFQYANPHYPDLDDTAVVAMAMDRAQGFRRQAVSAGDRACARVDQRPAESERRMGRLRRRQRIPLPQQHSLLRPRRAPRSADRGSDRPLRVHAVATRRARGEQPGGSARARFSPPHPASATGAGMGAGA